ncbi:MAG: ABC transporter substrate-binding protein, partial [Pseudomonadota bacterium]
SAFSDYPAAATKLPHVADASGVNIEALLVEKPDLVLVWPNGTSEADIVRLKMLGIRTEAIGIFTLADVANALRRIGQLADTSKTADFAADQFELRRRMLQNKYAHAKKVPTFFEISHAPLMTINGLHFISQVISLCGGANIFADVRQLVFQPSREMLLIKSPQVIFFGANKLAGKSAMLRDAALYAGLNAAQQGNIFALEADLILRPGPRLIDAAEEACGILETIRRKVG